MRNNENRKRKTMKHKHNKHQSSPADNRPIQEDVARRAYELYQARGSEPGHELQDWLQAEQELVMHVEVVHSNPSG